MSEFYYLFELAETLDSSKIIIVSLIAVTLGFISLMTPSNYQCKK